MAATGYGLLTTGFYAKPTTQISSEIDEALRGILGESAGTEEDGTIPTQSMAGQLKALLVDREAAQWEIMAAIYAAVDPSKNSGASQDAVGSISGVVRIGQQYSVATGIMTGNALTVIDSGSVATVSGTGSRFVTGTAATLAAANAWATGTVYAVGDIVTNNSRIYRCITAGTSAGSGGPTTVSNDITDNTAHWRYMGEGTAYAILPFTAETVGAIGALVGRMTGIATPIDGWRSIQNPLDANVGRAKETDSAYRARRDQQLAEAGNTTVAAIRSAVLAVNEGSADPSHEPPTAVRVLFNDSDITDSQGLPPHSVEVIVLDGTTADIAEAIWESKGAGTYLHGTTSQTITDSEGNEQTVRFTRPTEIPIYVSGTVKFNQAVWPASSEAAIEQAVLSALLTYTADYAIGTDVRLGPLMAAILRGPYELDDDNLAVVPADLDADPVPGLLEVESLFLGTTASPSTTTQVTITDREVATFASGNMDFSVEAETP